MNLEELKSQATMLSLLEGHKATPIFAATPGSKKKYISPEAMIRGWERGDVFIAEDGESLTQADADRLHREGHGLVVLYQGTEDHPQPVAIDVAKFLKHRGILN